MNKRVTAILQSLLRDMKGDDPILLENAQETLGNPVVVSLLSDAGCPMKYINAMQDTLHLSDIERKYCCGQILIKLKQEEQI